MASACSLRQRLGQPDVTLVARWSLWLGSAANCRDYMVHGRAEASEKIKETKAKFEETAGDQHLDHAPG